MLALDRSPSFQLGIAALLVLSAACRGAGEPEGEPSSPAQALLERSLRYHDPGGAWGREPLAIHWVSSKPDGETSFDIEVVLEPDGGIEIDGRCFGRELEYRVEDGVAWARVDGQEPVAEEVRSELALARDDGLFWRDYIGFLAGLPMCLADPGVSVEPEVSAAELEGRSVQAIRVSFAPEIGTDAWTFYFEPDSAALVGCRFDREDPTRDGETLVFEGASTVAGLRLPRTRRWYMNADRRFLGTDELRASSR